MNTPLAPGATIGIVGGGQLGSFLAVAARHLGYRVHVFASEPFSPAGLAADAETVGDWHDPEAVKAFAAGVSVLTIETEAVPWRSLAAAEEVTVVRPGSGVLRWTQNRLEQRDFLRRHHIPVGAYQPVLAPGDAAQAAAKLGLPVFLKLAETGYDGRGQVRVAAGDDPEEAWASLGRRPAIAEAFVPFEHEFAVILARDAAGQAVCFAPIQTVHRDGVLDLAWAPAAIPPRAAREGEAIARAIGDAAGLIGLLCVECYALPDGSVLVNEAAARPHNAGHLTIDACVSSQFDQMARALTGLSLSAPDQKWPAAMANILGDHRYTAPDQAPWRPASIVIHDYAKKPRPGRKLAHVTAVARSVEVARTAALAVRAAVAVPQDAPPASGPPAR